MRRRWLEPMVGVGVWIFTVTSLSLVFNADWDVGWTLGAEVVIGLVFFLGIDYYADLRGKRVFRQTMRDSFSRGRRG